MKKKEEGDKSTIEDGFKALDKIIEQMDDEKCSIEKSLELYEKGVLMIDSINKKVEKIEKTIEVLGEK